MGNLLEDQCTFMISRRVLIRITHISDESCRGIKKKIIQLVFFFFENRVICEIMFENTVMLDRLQMTIWRM